MHVFSEDTALKSDICLLLYSRFWYSHTQAYRFRAQPHGSLTLCQRSFLFQFIREFHKPVTSAEIRNNLYQAKAKKKKKKPCCLFFLTFTVKSKLVLKNTADKTLALGLLGEIKWFPVPLVLHCLQNVWHMSELREHFQELQKSKLNLVPMDSGELEVSWHKKCWNAWTDSSKASNLYWEDTDDLNGCKSAQDWQDIGIIAIPKTAPLGRKTLPFHRIEQDALSNQVLFPTPSYSNRLSVIPNNHTIPSAFSTVDLKTSS